MTYGTLKREDAQFTKNCIFFIAYIFFPCAIVGVYTLLCIKEGNVRLLVEWLV